MALKIFPTALSVFLTSIIFPTVNTQSIVERSNALALLLTHMQCFPSSENGDPASQIIPEINQNFHPEEHLDSYINRTSIDQLLNYTNHYANHSRNDDPFTNSPEHISQLELILNVLYPNSDNWPLFYNTSAWLLDRVNDAQLYWALMIVSGEKFSKSVTVPTTVEVFPQLFIQKRDVLSAAGLPLASQQEDSSFPLNYWTGDPGLNTFHTNWHIDNPFWWDENVYGVKRNRKGELFLYMHHQMVCRYNAELLSNGLPEVTALELDPDYQFPEPYTPDIVNINYGDFPPRKKGERFRDYESANGKSLNNLKTWFDRLWQGIEQGYFEGPQEARISLREANNTDILGSTAESSTVHSANLAYYGSFHNYLHRELGGMSKEPRRTPGVESHSETAMRDPVFFRLHRKVDSLFLQLKTHAPAYTKNELDFPSVSIKSVEIQMPRRWDDEPEEAHWPFDIRWPFNPQTPTLTTYFAVDTYDISNAARPCKGINDEPVYAQVKTLSYMPFKYVITVQSTRNQAAYGMVRIFMWPEYTQEGKKLEGDEAHQRAIEMDRFRIQIDPAKEMVITRSSINSSLTRLEHAPGIKALYKAKQGSSLLRPELKRACGFPNNLLVPKGTKDGVKYKLVVYISDETEGGWVDEYPNYPLCGALNGIPYPDSRPMGFPFDRPGTKFVANGGVWPVIGPTQMKNVKEIKILIKHQESKSEKG